MGFSQSKPQPPPTQLAQLLCIDFGTCFIRSTQVSADEIRFLTDQNGNRSIASTTTFYQGERLNGTASEAICLPEAVFTRLKRSLSVPEFDLPHPFPTLSVVAAIGQQIEAAVRGAAAKSVLLLTPARLPAREASILMQSCKVAIHSASSFIAMPSLLATAVAAVADRSDPFKFLVLDIGGGFTGAAVFEWTPHQRLLQVKASDGLAVGGCDVDSSIAEFLFPTDSKRFLQRRLRAAEKAKKQLGMLQQVQLDDGGEQFQIERSQLASISKGFVREVEQMLQRTLKKVPRGMPSQVFLVGGSSRLQSVGELVASLLPRAPIQRTLNVEESAAFGAAIFGCSKGIKIQVQCNWFGEVFFVSGQTTIKACTGWCPVQNALLHKALLPAKDGRFEIFQGTCAEENLVGSVKAASESIPIALVMDRFGVGISSVENGQFFELAPEENSADSSALGLLKQLDQECAKVAALKNVFDQFLAETGLCWDFSDAVRGLPETKEAIKRALKELASDKGLSLKIKSSASLKNLLTLIDG